MLVAITRHLTESFGAQIITSPRASDTVLQADVALAIEAQSFQPLIRILADRIAAAVNRDAAATHRPATPSYIRTVARLHARDYDFGTANPVSILAVSGGAELSAVTPYTHKKVVFLICSVRGLAVVS